MPLCGACKLARELDLTRVKKPGAGPKFWALLQVNLTRN
jgi:hypothetical protein